ncbi:sulfate transporter [Microbacterium mangrovi]|uniref:Sulfate transporter n=1 Tax=Microbacterium mangrovi TaxID=1348253 RepID=A0A0B2A6N0_9MICO|nr:sulfate transporter [Microbacterium mangrovi]
MAPTLQGYRRGWLWRDILAGLSAGAVVVPQAMAYATIANMPVQVGLYTCMVPMFVYAMLGGSRAMSTSTTSTIATLTATTLVSAGVAAGSSNALGSLVTLTFVVGVILLILRLLRLGGIVENISQPTIIGVQIGVGATVAIGQLPKLLGVSADLAGKGFLRALATLATTLGEVNVPTVLLSAGSIAALFLFKRFVPRLPGPLLVVAGGILLAAFTGMTDAGVELIAPVKEGLPGITLPKLVEFAPLLGGALAIALMAFLESVAVARGIREQNDPAIDSNRELLALSAANILGSLFTVLPVAGGFSQSAVNKGAGARSQLAQLVTVVLAVLIALFLGPVLSLLPQATLASLVFVAVVGLIKLGDLFRLARISPIDFWVALTTALVGITLGLLPAVTIGVLITLVLVLAELNKPRVRVGKRRGDALAIHIDRGLYTANVNGNLRVVFQEAVAAQPPITAVVLDLYRLEAATITVVDALAELDRNLAAEGITLHLAALPDRALTVARRMEWFQGVEASGRAHPSVHDGLCAAASAPA